MNRAWLRTGSLSAFGGIVWLVIGCLVIGCLGIALRCVGMTRGTTDFAIGQADTAFYSFHPDETTLLRASAELRSPLAPPLTAYGLLPIYLARGAVELAGWVSEPIDSSTNDGQRRSVLAVRVTAIGLSLLTAAALLAFAWGHFGRSTALWAAAFTCAPPLLLQSAHFYTVDGLFGLLFLLVLWATAAARRNSSLASYLVVGILVGLAGSVRITGLSLGVLLLAVHLTRPEERPAGHPPSVWRRLLPGNLWLAGGVALLVVLALQPYLLVSPALMTRLQSTDDFAFSVGIARGDILRPWSLADFSTVPWLHFWTHLLPTSVGWPMTLLLTTSVPWVLWRREPQLLLVLGACVLYFAPVGGLHTKHVRYLLPLIPPLSLLAAAMLTHAARRLTVRPWAHLAGVVTLAWTILYGLAFARIYVQQDARITAARWIADNVPVGATIAVEGGAFTLAGLIDPDRHQVTTLNTNIVFATRGHHTCESVAHYMVDRLQTADWVALVDVNRQRQFAAAPQLYPGLASFYEELLAGRLGFVPASRHKVTPGIGPLSFPDDDAEPSFLGFDHPAVHILKRAGGFREMATTWQRSAAELPHCPDRYLERVARAMVQGSPEQALVQAAEIPSGMAPGVTSLLLAMIYRDLGDPDAMQRELNRFSTNFEDPSLSAFLIPWATASSLVHLGLPELGMGALRIGVRHLRAFDPTERPAMAQSYTFVVELLRQQGAVELAEEAARFATEIDASQ